jgi:hypothetical protein
LNVCLVGKFLSNSAQKQLFRLVGIPCRPSGGVANECNQGSIASDDLKSRLRHHEMIFVTTHRYDCAREFIATAFHSWRWATRRLWIGIPTYRTTFLPATLWRTTYPTRHHLLECP